MQTLDDVLQRLRSERKEARKAAKAKTRAVKKQEKRRARLKKAAKQLSDEDLAMVLLEKNGARS